MLPELNYTITIASLTGSSRYVTFVRMASALRSGQYALDTPHQFGVGFSFARLCLWRQHRPFEQFLSTTEAFICRTFT